MTSPVGWLASEGGLPVDIDVDGPTAFAGKPAPTGFMPAYATND
jgi:hypothetical protein